MFQYRCNTHNQTDISLFVMNIQLENKHSDKRKLRKEIKKIYTELKRNLSFIVLGRVLQQIHIVV